MCKLRNQNNKVVQASSLQKLPTQGEAFVPKSLIFPINSVTNASPLPIVAEETGFLKKPGFF
jgi:hypothetical protein